MALVQQLCKEEKVGILNVWDCFVSKEEMYVTDGMHLSGIGAGISTDSLKRAVDRGRAMYNI